MRRLYLTLIVFLSLTSQIFPQGWEWQNPQPQGHTLNNLFVIDSTHAWATGFLGALVYTDDGENWKLHKGINTIEKLGGIFFTSNQIGWFVTRSSDKVYKTTNGGITWDIIASIGFNLVKIYFINENVGVVTGEGYCAKTIDGGLNWQSIIDSTGVTFGQISFIDSLTGWISSSVGLIYKTEDGGNNWIKQHTGFNLAISDMQFTSADSGWLSNTNYILNTTDSGETWLQQYYSNYHSLISLHLINNRIGWFFNARGDLYLTYNSGINWTWVTRIGPHLDFWFDKNHKGWGVDSYGVIRYTTNGGFDWIEQSKGVHSGIGEISFADSLNGAAITGGTIIRTTNGGDDWSVYSSVNGNSLYDVEFYDSSRGWILGHCNIYFTCSGGIIMRTTNAGASWYNHFSAGYDDVHYFSRSHFISQDLGFVIGKASSSNLSSVLLKTTNGYTWEVVDYGANIYLFDIFFIDSSNGWISGYEVPFSGYNYKILRTTDGGENWNVISTSSLSGYNLVFVTHQKGFLSGNKFSKTTDGGISWSIIGDGGGEIIFADSLNGWYLYGSTVRKTTDGGENWDVINIPTNLGISGLAVKNKKHIWVSGDRGAILKYTDPTVTIIETEKENKIPKDFSLFQNYPNPFNPTTKIKFTIPSNVKRQTSIVNLKVYDVLGREIATLVYEEKPAGEYEVMFDGTQLSSGIYFYQLQSYKHILTKKMVLLK